MLKLSGVAVLSAVLAGCGDEGPGDEDEEEPANGDEDQENGDEEGDNGNGEAIEPGEIELGGETSAWQGVAPDEINGEENPTLTLQEGESYEIMWENLDGVGHNIEIRDDGDEVVDDYETDIIDEEGETQTLEIDEVTDEMAQYVCEPHAGTMVGDIEVA
ncbi:Copper binding protein, plastocyanin/azurin family [Natronorubrum texcoconense]|uniref:Copper binding protein, plastocyanin/azurin family n=2 Tax=Natronorubrum texcoconense TaxID=1095776 RepID=A0A1G9FVS8_9EURY|nr:Copper binding protein, plastocyanin/azurin family [Natronorubrum texcoconense]